MTKQKRKYNGYEQRVKPPTIKEAIGLTYYYCYYYYHYYYYYCYYYYYYYYCLLHPIAKKASIKDEKGAKLRGEARWKIGAF